MIFGNCPSCHEAFVVGLGQQPPVIQYVLRPVDCENKKKALIQAIKESSLTDEQKKVMTETYGAEGLMIDPVAADFMIQELRTSYAKIGKKTCDECKKEICTSEACMCISDCCRCKSTTRTGAMPENLVVIGGKTKKAGDKEKKDAS